MHRVLFSILLLLIAAPVSSAFAAQSVQTSGDPAIDAQWVQLASSANPYGSTPVNPNAMQPTGIFRALFGPRQPAAQPRPRQAPAAAPRTTPRAPVTRRAPAAQPSRQIARAYLPAVVDYPTNESPGTIVIDTGSRYLYRVLEDGRAQRYGVGVGREGFGWSGRVRVGRKAEWPTWTPPAEMRKRQPYLPVSMKGGPDNPLGARALYLYDGGRDTLFRIHGSNQPWTIGHAVSSGCIRMRNEDVIELYNAVGIGTRVVVF
jgi:lipoprotein-anchoring transpeptidase ErfK/SrfK